MPSNIQVVRKSSNAKTGPIPTTTSARATCPAACPLAGPGGCYAEAGYYTRMNWDKVDNGERGTDYASALKAIASLPTGQLWRHNVAGDLQGADDRIDSSALFALVDANTDKRGFTYTHYPLVGEHGAHNARAIRAANARGFTINVSANNPSEARTLRAIHALPTVTVVSENYWQGSKRRGGIVRCPAEYRDDVTCASCGLCQKRDRKDIVGFTAHGTRKAAANIIATAA